MFFPIGDDNSRRRTFPIVVWAIFLVNAFVWFLELQFGEPFIYGYSVVPREIVQGVDLASAVRIPGAQGGEVLQHALGPSPIYLTLLSAMFMHGSWMHIIGNMVYLLIFADQIEDELGHFRFLFFYLVCGLAASVAHILAGPDSVIPSLGASGAIAGVLGAYLIRHPNNPVRVLVRTSVVSLPAYLVLGFWVVLQVIGQMQDVGGMGGGVAYMAHIGGFVAGVPLVLLLARR